METRSFSSTIAGARRVELLGAASIRSAFLSLVLIVVGGCKTAPYQPDLSTFDVRVSGQISVNGQMVPLNSNGIYNSMTRTYEIRNLASADLPLEARQLQLLSWCPRIALSFAVANAGPSLLDTSKDGIRIQFRGRRKVDEVSSVSVTARLNRLGRGLAVACEGSIATTTDRPLEEDGEAVIRLGINPVTGTFSGGARINYDASAPDPGALGTADFWNLDGSFEGARASAESGYAHVDHCGGDLDGRMVKGILSRFPASTLVLPGILTFSGVAHSHGVIHQFLGISNQAGAGRTLVTFPVNVRKGMTASEVATAVQQGFAQSRNVNPEMRYILAVQGGDGVSSARNDPTSAQLAVSMTLDGNTVAGRAAIFQNPLNQAIAVQAFSDQGTVAQENSGIRNQFGVLGQPPLTGWLTPFKIVFTTDNPATGNQAAGGKVAVLLNWTESVDGVHQQEGSTTSFEDLVISTRRGQSAEEVMALVVAKLKAQQTDWGTYPFIQRAGNVLYIDAGIEFPHIVSLGSDDHGVGYMSAAADLPFFPQ